MWWLRFPLFAIVLLVLTSPPVLGQRDRDTYNPSNQTLEISGQVNVAGSNVPVSDVPVRLERFSGGIIDQVNTDPRGRFRFGNLQRGYYKLIINVAGYGPAQQEADLSVLFKSYHLFNLLKIDPNGPKTATVADVIDARVPPEAREEFGRGRDALAKGNRTEAITHLQKAVALHTQFFDAELLLATAYMDQRQWPEAEAALVRALEIKPENPAALLALGEVYWRQKRFDDAERTLLDGLKVDQNNWHGQFTLGRLYWEKGDVMRAAPAIGHTLQLKPDFAEGHLMAGNILLRLNQPSRALLEFQEYLRLAPKGEYAAETRGLVEKLRQQSSQH